MRYIILILATTIYVLWTQSAIKCFKSGGVNFHTAIWIVVTTGLLCIAFGKIVDLIVKYW